MCNAKQEKRHSLPRALQELPPACRQLCLHLRRFLHELAPLAGAEAPFAGSPVLVAFSGGADSTALALGLRCLGFDLCLAHLDHGLRQESAAEAEAARRFAQDLGVPCMVEKTDVAAIAAAKGQGLEETGRAERYRFLQEARRLAGAGWIATGHHMDDLCEDMLLRLLRGTGWPGLGGMAAIDPERRLLRPLLSTPKERLVAFLNALGLNWQEDASNRDLRFTRNRVRADLLPLIRVENPAFSRSALALWHMAREDEAYWAEQVAPVLRQLEERPCPETGPLGDASTLRRQQKGPGGELFLPRAAFIALPRALRLRVYMALVRKGARQGLGGQARAETLFRLDTACQSGTAHKMFQLPGSLCIVTDKAGLHLRAERTRAWAKPEQKKKHS